MFNPSLEKDFTNRESLGLFQYTGDRAKQLKANKPNWNNDWKSQIDFALSEQSTKNYLSKKFNSAEEATYDFTVNWEIPQNKEKEGELRKAYLPYFNF